MKDPTPRASHLAVLDALAVYLKPRVLIVLFLGFASGLPFALTGSTLQIWMRESGVDLGTIGLFALVGMPYAIKFLWAPVLDALDVPLLSRWLGRRRGWLLFSQLLLMAAIACLASSDPKTPVMVAAAALFVATASATQDIVIDAFRVESLDEREQAAGMASYVAAYRIGVLASTAGALFLVSAFEGAGATRPTAWALGLAVMATLVAIGIVTTFVASEPENAAARETADAAERSRPVLRVARAALDALVEFLTRKQAIVALIFVVLYKLPTAFAGDITAPFVIDIGFSRNQYAAIAKGLGVAATLLGGFAGGFIARAYPLAPSLWIGGVLQAAALLTFSWQAVLGPQPAMLAFAISTENFTAGIATMIFVAYLSALCRNPLHTATQFALLTALAAVARTFLSSDAGYVATATGWPLFFAVAALLAIPGLLVLGWLQRGGHFVALETELAVERRTGGHPAAA